MESIVKFSYPDVRCRCTLKRIVRRRFVSVEELLAKAQFTQSTVGLPDGSNVEQLEVRNSKRFTTMVEFDMSSDLVNYDLRKLLSDDIPMWDNTLEYDIIEYSVGGFFKEHQDKKIKENHFATLLIFPPAVGSLTHTGGELIIDRGRFHFDSSSNREWTFIAFHTELPHECKEVLSGRRVVFKTELYSEKPVLRRQDRYPEFGVMDRGIRHIPPTPDFTD